MRRGFGVIALFSLLALSSGYCQTPTGAATRPAAQSAAPSTAGAKSSEVLTANQALILSTAISTVIAAAMSLVVVKITVNSNKNTWLSDRVAELNRLAIEYPYLEDDKFCSNLPMLHSKYDERYLRYENYCCLVFNALEANWLRFKGNEKKMDRILFSKEMILRHQKWWQSPVEASYNRDGYEERFATYVDQTIKKNILRRT